MNQLLKQKYIRSLQLILKLGFVVLLFITTMFTATMKTENNENFVKREDDYSYSFLDTLLGEHEELDEEIENFSMKYSERSDIFRLTAHGISGSEIFLLIILLLLVIDISLTLVGLINSQKLHYRKWFSIFTVLSYIVFLFVSILISTQGSECYCKFKASSKPGVINFMPDGAVVAQKAVEINFAPFFYVAAALGFIIVALELYFIIFSKKENIGNEKIRN